MLTVGASRETLIKGAHNKSMNKTVVWGYSIVTAMRHGWRRIYKG